MVDRLKPRRGGGGEGPLPRPTLVLGTKGFVVEVEVVVELNTVLPPAVPSVVPPTAPSVGIAPWLSVGEL